MHFIVDAKHKVLFGYNRKCGSSHVLRIIWYLVRHETDPRIHGERDRNNPLPLDIEHYTTILFIRNPYERIVAGFLEKYSKRGGITFQTFVEELETANWDSFDPMYFSPQTSYWFQSNHILRSKQLRIFDCRRIDYSFLETLYKTKLLKQKIPIFKTQQSYAGTFVGNLDIRTYCQYAVPIQCFYDSELRKKVRAIYQMDFAFFEEHSFSYSEKGHGDLCERHGCKFLKHADPSNNGGTHCCRKCLENQGHGHLCSSYLKY